MAKLGEGDDRWIVKEREDGRNVNNWHWSETSYTEWAREKLGARFEGVAIGDGTRSAGKLLSLETMKGDVTVQSRKQKRFPLYELELTIRWEGQLFDASGGTAVEAKGRIKVPDLSEETYDDLEMTVLCDEETDAKRPLKELVRKEGGKAVRAACLAFVKELKETVMKGHEPPPQKAPPRERFNAGYVAASAETAKTGAVKVVYSYNPPPHVLYETLLDTQRIRGITASDASMSTEVGGKLMMFSGAVEGENAELKPFDGERAVIKWKWRFSTWQPSHWSTVLITMVKQDDGSTKLTLEQTGVPEDERERTERGWKGMLFEPMNAMLGGRVIGA
ncbi:hypothetical protein EMIHUDRAFT_436574 [Emiliania huxleyi CCMP1516]|uniref:Activator of Hsp90 ATPase AHSA1-like N-terminal domain-containing protein n=2 Tax=Emiliania huxleyi TaxID=2903 RepID=A0A0D3IYN8_EMIH1|nr:hypothetical protein EMIHUDRAFT_436574 [Emiliania huxleyi CCMP1516]EOD16373.1 hypothetical protein EMIHUDRAFT_436574 [Emiliania huxleyi CCMP1516]|eukprot:XP_005768802.1 hypothetical protein EMIHUDRAFT_436574 [Emiliania huxleyi CCMP1516]